MSIIIAEQDFTAYIAGVLSLTVDSTIMRGNSSVLNVLGVHFTSGSGDNTPRCNSYRVHLLGHFASRDVALGLLEKLNSEFPVWGKVQNKSTFSILKSSGGIFPNSHNNVDCTTISVNFAVECRVSGSG